MVKFQTKEYKPIYLNFIKDDTVVTETEITEQTENKIIAHVPKTTGPRPMSSLTSFKHINSV